MVKLSKKLPLWYQLVMTLRSEIQGGARAPGSRIEPETQFAAKHGVSVMPVRQAMRSLEAEGLIVRRRGHGTFVAANVGLRSGTTSLESLYSAEFKKEARLLQRGIVPTPDHFASSFAQEEELAFVERLAFKDGAPWSFGKLYFLREFDSRLTATLLKRYPLYRVMSEQYGVALIRTQFEASAKAASAQVARRLGIDPFSPVLHLRATSYDDSARAVGAFELSFVAAPYVFSFDTNHGPPSLG